MSYDFSVVNERLERWGQWRLNIIKSESGYSGMSIFGKIFDDGGFLPASSSGRFIPVDLHAEEIDCLVNEMSRIKDFRIGRDCLIIRYSSFSEKEALKKSGIKPGTYKKAVDMAKSWLSGRLKCESEK